MFFRLQTKMILRVFLLSLFVVAALAQEEGTWTKEIVVVLIH